MKKRIHSALLLFIMLSGATHTRASDTVEQIEQMQHVLIARGLQTFLLTAQHEGWSAPHIPSKWHLESVAVQEQIPANAAARAFGRSLLEALAEIASCNEAHTLEDAQLLLDLSEWCASTVGYGNVFLAQRSMDIASVAAVHLAADLDFPIEACSELFRRFDPDWLKPAFRKQVLNKDAGVTLFRDGTQAGLQSAWRSGRVLKRDRNNPVRKVEREKSGLDLGVSETPEIVEHLDFFEDDSVASVPLVTQLSMWDRKWHGRIVIGLELQNVIKAKSLLEFREMVGAFPKEDNPKSPYRGAKGAFDEAWRSVVSKHSGMSSAEWNLRLGVGITAWRTYDEVARGEVFDCDTRQVLEHNALVAARQEQQQREMSTQGVAESEEGIGDVP